MIGRVHKIEVPVLASLPDHSLLIDGKLCLEQLGQTIQRVDYPDYFAALNIPAGVDQVQIADKRGMFSVGCASGVQGFELGDTGGSPTTAIGVDNLPPHNHPMFASSMPGLVASPEGNVFAASVVDRGTGETVDPEYTTPEFFVPAQMHIGSIGNAGGGQDVNIMPPYAVSRYFIQVVE